MHVGVGFERALTGECTRAHDRVTTGRVRRQVRALHDRARRGIVDAPLDEVGDVAPRAVDESADRLELDHDGARVEIGHRRDGRGRMQLERDEPRELATAELDRLRAPRHPAQGSEEHEHAGHGLDGRTRRAASFA